MPARRATPADAPEVVRLAALMYSTMGLDTTAEWAALAHAELVRRVLDDGGGAAAFVVDRPDGAPGLAASGVGLISLRLPSPPNPAGRFGYIQWVATEPEFRRRGLARAIMSAVLDWFGEQRVPVVELHATEEGEPLYRDLGFGTGGGIALRRRSWDDPSPCR